MREGATKEEAGREERREGDERERKINDIHLMSKKKQLKEMFTYTKVIKFALKVFTTLKNT